MRYFRRVVQGRWPRRLPQCWAAVAAQVEPFAVGGQSVGKFLAPGLDGEIFLGVGDLGFSRVAVLGNQVAGEAGEVEIVYITRAAGAEFDHFAGVGKMVSRRVPRLDARGLGAIDGVGEAAPLTVAEKVLEVARAPVGRAVRIGSGRASKEGAVRAGSPGSLFTPFLRRD